MKLINHCAVFLCCIVVICGCAMHRNDESASNSASDHFIVVDGSFDDWAGVGQAIDDSGDVLDSGLDISGVWIEHEPDYVHLLISLNREVNVQRLDGTLKMLIDGDGQPDTGAERHNMHRVDFVISFTPENPRDPTEAGMGVGVESTTYAPAKSDEAAKLSHSDLGFVLAPTYAAKRIECRINRSSSLPNTSPIFQNSGFSLKLVLINKDGLVADETDVMSHVLASARTDETGGETAKSVDSIPVKSADSMRLISWNVLYGNVLKRPDIAGRILDALDPDVLFLQEMTDKDSANSIKSFLNSKLSDADNSWNVLFGAGGGPLRCAVASRLPIETVDALALVPYPDRPDRQVRIAGGIVTGNGRRILLSSVHLKCCGSIGSREDDARLEEVTLINQAVRAASAADRFDAVVIGGDLNLVGGYAPMRSLGAGIDMDGTDLTILEPYRLDARSNTTWADRNSAFAPGRLDFVLLSDVSLKASQAFVFDSADLSEEWLRTSSVAASDSSTVSDHFPIVVDLVWNE